MTAFIDDESDDLYDPSSFDKIIDLRRVFGPRSAGRQPRNPPAIGIGEITSSRRRDVGALEVIARLRQQRHRGQPAGLAWYTPTGLVRYSVVNPSQSRILWQGNLGRVPGLAAMSPSQRETAVRQLITQRTGQRFRSLRHGHRGPDLVPAFDASFEAMQDGFHSSFSNGSPHPRNHGAKRDEFLDENGDLDEFWPWARRHAAAARIALAVTTGAQGQLSGAEKRLQDRTELVAQQQDREIRARNRRTSGAARR